jgi:hypothetical protein
MEKKKKNEIAYKEKDINTGYYCVFAWVPTAKDYYPGSQVNYKDACMLVKAYKDTWVFELQDYLLFGQLDIAKKVHQMLKDREINPSGEFDKQGRFYATHQELLSCRQPSKAWPYSQMQAARTFDYVCAVIKKFNCKTIKEVLAHV